MKEDIVLVNPNFEDSPLVREDGIRIFFPNLGLDSIDSNLDSKHPNLSVHLVDGVLHNLSKEQIVEKVLKRDPRIIGVSTTYMTLQDSLDIVREIRKEAPEVITVLGGSGARSLRAISKGENIEGLDYCVIGDGERVFEKIINEGKNQERTEYIEDIIYDLDSLEFPKRTAFDTERYMKILQKVNPLNKNERFLNIYTSKGCSWGRCTFCAVDNHYRTRNDLRKIQDEVKYLIRKFKVSKLFFADDNFFSVEKSVRTYRICEILGGFPQLKWNVGETRVADFVKNVQLGKKILRKMKENRCFEICWGVESGDNRILTYLRKGITVNDIETVIKMSTEAGIISKLLLMYNLPGETKESLNNTLDFVKHLVSTYCIDLLKVSEYANIPGTIDWVRGYNNSVRQDDLARFRNKLAEFCVTKNVVISFLGWGKRGHGKGCIRI